MRAVMVVGALVLWAGCDPMAPGASGSVDLAAELDATDFAWLNIVAHSDADGMFQADDVMLQMDRDINEVRGMSVALSEVSFPWEYDLGGGVGATEVQSWRVTAWLSADETPEAPMAGDLWGSTAFEMGSCGRMGYCDTSEGVDVMIDGTFE